MTRRLVREEGLFAGASSGAAVAGALKYLRRHDREGMVAVVILPDSAKNYLSKMFNDNWMEENGFFDSPTISGRVADLLKNKLKTPLISLPADTTIATAIATLKKNNISQVPVIDEGRLIGTLTESKLLQRALRGEPANDTIRDLADLDFCIVHPHSELANLTELFRRFKVALVYDGHVGPTEIITRIDLIDYISSI